MLEDCKFPNCKWLLLKTQLKKLLKHKEADNTVLNFVMKHKPISIVFQRTAYIEDKEKNG